MVINHLLNGMIVQVVLLLVQKSGVYQLRLIVEIPCVYRVFYISAGCFGISAINSMKGNQVASHYRPIGENVGLIWGKSWQIDVRLNQRFTPCHFHIRFGNHVASKHRPSLAGGWTNPVGKICSSNLDIFPQVGMKMYRFFETST